MEEDIYEKMMSLSFIYLLLDMGVSQGNAQFLSLHFPIILNCMVTFVPILNYALNKNSLLQKSTQRPNLTSDNVNQYL
jgi:hypothetical protein